MSRAARIPVICESCFMAYQDIAYDRDEDDETREVAAMFMADMGRDVPDHLLRERLAMVKILQTELK